MAASNKKPLASHDVSTDTDDDIQYDSDSPKDETNNENDLSSSTNVSSKHRGYKNKFSSNYFKNKKKFFSSRTKRINNKMKPCLVHRTSTSDEELQTHLVSRINEQPPHGILKVPSGSTSPELQIPNINLLYVM